MKGIATYMRFVSYALFLMLNVLVAVESHAAITFIASTTDRGNDDRATLRVPGTSQTDDLLVVQVAIRNRSGSDGVSGPAGWIEIGSQRRDGDVLQSIYYRIATAADAGRNYTWDFDGNGNRRYILGMQVFRGVDTADPIDGNSSRTGMSFTSVTAPSVTTSAANAMLVAFYSLEAGNEAFYAGVGMTEAYDVEEHNGGNGITAMAAWEVFAGPGATGDRVATASKSNDDAIGHLVALQVAAQPPELLSLAGSCAAQEEITVTFSEAVDAATAETASNYRLVNAAGNSILINTANRISANVVELGAAVLLNDLTEYTVTVNNVEDLDGNAIAADSALSFSLSCQTNCFSDSFPGPGALGNDWYAAGSSGSFGIPRVARDGALRLTDASGNVATVANLLLQFPGAENRIEVEFDYYAYNGSGADGVAVTFSDASITPVPGSYGGALGYAQRNNGTPGFAGGWLGVGIDEYGNFSNPNEGKSGGVGFRRDAIALRGSGTGQSGYNFLASSGTLNPGVDQGGSFQGPGHRYRIVIDHTMGGNEAYASVERDTGSGYVEVIPRFDVFAINPTQAAVPENWVVSFTGSTGGSTNIHEIENLQICAALPIDPYTLIDHYHIDHNGTGVTCEAETVTVTAHDASHNPVTVNSNTSLSLTTSPAVESISPASPTILAGDSSTTFSISQTAAQTNIDIDVSDGSRTDLDDGGSEDPAIDFLDTAFRFYANASNTDTIPIASQIAGKPSNSGAGSQSLTLRAVRTNTDTGACEAALQGLTEVDMAYECHNPGSCSGANRLQLTGDETVSVQRNNLGGALSYAPVRLNFDADGEAPFYFSFGDSGEISLHAHIDVPANGSDPAFSLDGESNAFVVRPFGLDLDFNGQRAADWTDDSVLNDSTGSNTSLAIDSDGTAYAVAGQPFNVQVRAVQWDAGDDLDNDGLPDANTDLSDNPLTLNFGDESATSTIGFSHSLVSPATGVSGSLTAPTLNAGGAGSDFSAGQASVAMSWDEVGIIELQAALNNYLGDSTADTIGIAGNLGRFVPDRFVVNALDDGSFQAGCNGFVYVGQGFGYLTSPSMRFSAVTLTGVPTQNYTQNGFLKLNASDVLRSWPVEDASRLGRDGINNLTTTVSPLTGSLATTGTAGEMAFTFNPLDQYRYDKVANAEVGAFDSDLSISTTSVSDSDGVSLSSAPSWTPAAVNIRYGRFFMRNVFGPETEALNMEAGVEYLDTSGEYVMNTDDDCTALPAMMSLTGTDGSVVGSPYTGVTVDTGNSDFSYRANLDSGSADFRFSSPGSGNTGSIDLGVDMSPLTWLRHDWDSDGSMDDPAPVSATFGQYRGNDRIIYWREVQP